MGNVEEKKSLAQKQCQSCKIAASPLESDCCSDLLLQLNLGWIIRDGRLEKEFKFKDFQQALDMVNEVGAIAEAQNHHPDVFLAWGKVKLTLYTHKVCGLTEDDFIFAAKIDQL